jgi:hypothetical protein
VKSWDNFTDGGANRFDRSRLRQQLGNVAGEIGLHVTVALLPQAKGILRVEISVVIDLDERLELTPNRLQ